MDKFNERSIAWGAVRREKLAAHAAAALLNGRRSESDVFRLASQLNNTDPVIRESALKNLAEIGGGVVLGSIARRVNDVAPNVRAAACEALGRLRAHKAKAQLYDALRDKNLRVQCAAATALARLGDQSGLPHVARLVCTRGPDEYRALRTLNRITGQDFPITQQGLKSARRWLKTRKRLHA